MIKDSVVLKSLKRTVVKMFREFLVYHNSSLEYRAKILTLIISADGEISECEKQKLKEIAHSIYSENQERAELLIDTVKSSPIMDLTLNISYNSFSKRQKKCGVLQQKLICPY